MSCSNSNSSQTIYNKVDASLLYRKDNVILKLKYVDKEKQKIHFNLEIDSIGLSNFQGIANLILVEHVDARKIVPDSANLNIFNILTKIYEVKMVVPEGTNRTDYNNPDDVMGYKCDSTYSYHTDILKVVFAIENKIKHFEYEEDTKHRLDFHFYKYDKNGKTVIEIDKTLLLDSAKQTNSDSIVSQFVELANAIKSRDCESLKTFFHFPVNNQYIWYKVLSENKLYNKNLAEPFTEKDFDKYYNKFFDIDIEKTIGTLNFETISNEIMVSDTVAVRNGIYLNKCVLSITFNDKNLILSVVSNLYDENNEFLTEHIDNYYFTLLNSKLIFKNFEMID
jgi:hypothetical protein